MTRLFLAGVAALAIATPAVAKPGGGGGGGHGNGNGGGGAAVVQGGGGGHGNGSGGGAPAPVFAGGGGHGHGYGGGAAVPMDGGGRGHGGGFAAPQTQRVERQQSRGFERQQARTIERQHGQAQNFQRQRGIERQQARAVEHQRGIQRQQAQNFQHQHGIERQQARAVERQQAQNLQHQRGLERQAARGFERQQMRANALQGAQQQAFPRPAERLVSRNFDARAARAQQQEFQQQLSGSRFAALNYGATPILAPTVVEQFVGVPIANVPSFASFSPLPASLQYLYPSTPDYYYQYGDGYVYQVDRGSNLIAALLPLLAGGYLPGQYVPSSYMSSYVPDYYGLNSFYPDSQYSCNRYYNGVIYQVDCATGYVENVVPMYAGGYGVGQMLPSAYNYYNVPTQYRSLYYDTSDYGYWYAPGAIYQYDPGSNVITSVAALMSPGFSLGQPMPVGYDVYNVPYDYRATYYDTPNAWYRYNNGYIYQVDPTTQIVTSIVASLLT